MLTIEGPIKLSIPAIVIIMLFAMGINLGRLMLNPGGIQALVNGTEIRVMQNHDPTEKMIGAGIDDAGGAR